jgi:hypothetical protein
MSQLRIAGITLGALLTLAAGAVAQKPHPRSSGLKAAPHSVERVFPELPQPEAQPRPALPPVPLGYEGSEHRDGIHHGYDGHHNWHLKGGR